MGLSIRRGRGVLAAALLLAVPVFLHAQAPEPIPPLDAEARFRALDRNHDDKLTEDELRNRALLRRVDTDKDGVVSREEMLAALKARKERAQRQDPSRGETVGAMTVYRGVAYGKALDIEPGLLMLDIYAPDKARGRPVLLYAHGGDGTIGDRADVGKLPAMFTGQNYVFVSVGFGLLPAADARGQARDLAAAIAWVADNIGRYGGDPQRLFLMNRFQGVHIGELTATDESNLKSAGKDLSVLKGVVVLDTGALDVARLMEIVPDENWNSFGDRKELWPAVSPISFVKAGKGIPPFLLVVSRPDDVEGEQAERFAAALANAGVPAQIFRAPGGGPREIAERLGDATDPTAQAALKFLNAQAATLRTGRTQ